MHKCDYPLGRKQYGLVYVQNGNAEYRFYSGDRASVGEGDLLFLAPSAAYSILIRGDFKHYTVNFDIRAESSSTGFLSGEYCLFRGAGNEQMKRALAELVSAWQSKRMGCEMQAMSCLYRILSMLCTEYGSRQGRGGNPAIHAAAEYIGRNFNQPMSLDQLAALARMSVTNFRREWKRVYGVSPLRYRDALRIDQAKQYLHSGYYTVTEIAAKCGFEDVSYFVRFFKKQTGVPPGNYRKDHVL